MNSGAHIAMSVPIANTGQTFPVGSWNSSWGKRWFDLCCGAFLLLLCLPLLLVLGILVKVSSRGPALFWQKRLGQNGLEFELLKFRTMTHGSSGPGITRGGDARVTAVGRLLRQWKLDELPQLINVVRGDMSLVGPRPDLGKYILALDADHRRILCLKPGVTGMASLSFPDEETLLAGVPADQLESYYVAELLPRKVQLDLAYAHSSTFFTDLRLLFRTVVEVIR
jgi:lipopolysaccharide/colanic/teichoic acid biosynthesis glycosyltransferase